MNIEKVLISTLIEDPSNARKHSEKNLEAIKGSLAKFGQQKPIVVGPNNVVIAGNGTLQAAKSLNWTEIFIARSDLKGVDLTGFAIADNRTGELAEWDMGVLGETLKGLDLEGFDLGSIGFGKEDLEKMMPTIAAEPGCDDDEIPEKVEPKTKPGDLYILGNHRLLCGDSTNIQHVERLMNGEKADMVFTDPPYGISYQSNMRTKSDRFNQLANDDVFITEWIGILPVVSEGWIFVWTTWKVIGKWIEITKPIGDMTNVIIWDKGGGGLGDLSGTFSTDYEIALVFNRGSNITGKRLGSVWSIGKDRAGDYQHPTQKPVELGEMAIINCTAARAKILDLFLGSGSTLIACEKTNRRCFGMEIDPHYCDVIVARWEKYTGKKAAYG